MDRAPLKRRHSAGAMQCRSCLRRCRKWTWKVLPDVSHRMDRSPSRAGVFVANCAVNAPATAGALNSLSFLTVEPSCADRPRRVTLGAFTPNMSGCDGHESGYPVCMTTVTNACCSTTVTTTTMLGSSLAPALKMSMGYAEKLLVSIPADQFAVMPKSDLNSPAFCIGHLALYAPWVCEMMGHPQADALPSTYEPLFKNGAPCVATPGHYPSKDELVIHFTKGWNRVALLLPTVADAQFAKPNPVAHMVERAPTIGALVSFMCLAHNMMHLGQISAWRRVMGLGSAM
ncbi:MAG: DinB family protein [Phycisphaerales bacterium]|nr:DinB family protein [Phycisphaerales bacterium]